MEEWRDKLLEESQDTVQLRLGDASIASPFTCKSTGIDKGRRENTERSSRADSSLRTMHAREHIPDLHHLGAELAH